MTVQPNSPDAGTQNAAMTPPGQDPIIVNDYVFRVRKDTEGSVVVTRWLRDGSEHAARRVINKDEIPPQVDAVVKELSRN